MMHEAVKFRTGNRRNNEERGQEGKSRVPLYLCVLIDV